MQRLNEAKSNIKVTAQDDHWTIELPANWLSENRLLSADLENEQEMWKSAGWQLDIV